MHHQHILALQLCLCMSVWNHETVDCKAHKFIWLLSANHKCVPCPVDQWECSHFAAQVWHGTACSWSLFTAGISFWLEIENQMLRNHLARHPRKNVIKEIVWRKRHPKKKEAYFKYHNKIHSMKLKWVVFKSSALHFL